MIIVAESGLKSSETISPVVRYVRSWAQEGELSLLSLSTLDSERGTVVTACSLCGASTV